MLLAVFPNQRGYIPAVEICICKIPVTVSLCSSEPLEQLASDFPLPVLSHALQVSSVLKKKLLQSGISYCMLTTFPFLLSHSQGAVSLCSAVVLLLFQRQISVIFILKQLRKFKGQVRFFCHNSCF